MGGVPLRAIMSISQPERGLNGSIGRDQQFERHYGTSRDLYALILLTLLKESTDLFNMSLALDRESAMGLVGYGEHLFPTPFIPLLLSNSQRQAQRISHSWCQAQRNQCQFS